MLLRSCVVTFNLILEIFHWMPKGGCSIIVTKLTCTKLCVKKHALTTQGKGDSFKVILLEICERFSSPTRIKFNGEYKMILVI